MFREQLEEFGDAVRGKTQPEVTGKEGIAALAIVYAALRSAETGRTVAMTEVLES
jgi:predicted dehydrogenase